MRECPGWLLVVHQLPLHLAALAESGFVSGWYTNSKSHSSTDQNSVECTWSTTTLRVAKRCNPSIKSKPVRQNIPDVVGANRGQIAVVSTFRDNHDRLALSHFSVLCELERLNIIKT